MNKLLAAAFVAAGLMGHASAQPALQLTPGARPAATVPTEPLPVEPPQASAQAQPPVSVAAPAAESSAAPSAPTFESQKTQVQAPPVPHPDARESSVESARTSPPVARSPVVSPSVDAPAKVLTTQNVPSSPRTDAQAPMAASSDAFAAPQAAPSASAPAPASATPALASTAAAPDFRAPAERIVSPVTRGSDAVNPFTGKALNAEQAQRQLELLRMQTQVLEEQLKQVGLTEDMRNVPLRKSVEAATATTALRKEESQQRQLQNAMAEADRARAAEQAATRNAAQAARNSKAADKAPAQTVKNEPVVRTPAPVRLVSVVNVGAQRSAVLAVGDATMIVRDGEHTNNGTVEVLDETTVRVGARTLAVESMTLSRAVLPDKAQATDTPVVSPAPAQTPAATNSGLPPLLPPATNAAPGTMPALQLPPGVRLLQR